MSRILETLPDGYVQAHDSHIVAVGDLMFFRGKYVRVTEGAASLGRHPKDVIGRVLFIPKTDYDEDPYATPRQEVVFAALVKMAQVIIEHRGLQDLLNWRNDSHACCCMGPQDGEPLCSCAMSMELEKQKAQVLKALNITA